MTDIVVGLFLGGRTRGGGESEFFWRWLTRLKYGKSIKHWLKRSELLN